MRSEESRTNSVPEEIESLVPVRQQLFVSQLRCFQPLFCSQNEIASRFLCSLQTTHCGETNSMAQQQLPKYGAITVAEDDDSEKLMNSGLFNDDFNARTNGSKLVAWVFGIALLIGTSLLLVNGSINARPSNDVASLLGSSLSHDDMNKARFYTEQPVDHFDDEDPRSWSNRYYQSNKYFAGPGHPIFVIVGGEGALDHGMLYPFVTEVLAKRFKAAVLQIEHRFYGPYHPIPNATSKELLNLLTPHQAMADMVQLTRHVRDTEYDCSPDRSSPDYCSIITVGGSYPGFLSAMFRFVYPDFVDIAYASAAPLLMYGQAVPNTVYYDIVSSAADRASPGCSAAVRRTMNEMVVQVETAPSLQAAADRVGICGDSLPQYITTQKKLAEAIILISSYAFAEYNSENYPPGPDTDLSKACALFQNQDLSTPKTLESFFHSMVESEEELDEGCDLVDVECDAPPKTKQPKCFDLMSQLSGGPNSTLEDTGGDYEDGEMWDFQTCTNVIFLCGFSTESMFPPHAATYRNLDKKCRERFGVTPDPWELVHKWNFVDGISDASFILFVNGLQDMWAGGSVMDNVTDTVVAINLENGAHHSDLSHQGPTDSDTWDVKEGFVQIADTLEEWLDQLKSKKK